MKIAIIGSRNFNDYNFAENEINRIISENNIKIDKIISGGARGALRNTKIINESDVVIAFWNGESRGTKDSIDKSKKNNKLLFIVKVI
jgi:hypothetical protein